MEAQNLNYAAIGSRIRYIRRREKLSQEQLAELSGLSRQSISNIETNRKKASVEALVSIASALNVSLDDLLRNPKDDTLSELIYLYKQCSPKERLLLLSLSKSIFSVLRKHNFFNDSY